VIDHRLEAHLGVLRLTRASCDPDGNSRGDGAERPEDRERLSAYQVPRIDVAAGARQQRVDVTVDRGAKVG
jgi:hypothetical protein